MRVKNNMSYLKKLFSTSRKGFKKAKKIQLSEQNLKVEKIMNEFIIKQEKIKNDAINKINKLFKTNSFKNKINKSIKQKQLNKRREQNLNKLKNLITDTRKRNEIKHVEDEEEKTMTINEMNENIIKERENKKKTPFEVQIKSKSTGMTKKVDFKNYEHFKNHKKTVENYSDELYQVDSIQWLNYHKQMGHNIKDIFLNCVSYKINDIRGGCNKEVSDGMNVPYFFDFKTIFRAFF